MWNCSWHNGQPLTYTNWADDMTTLNKHVSIQVYSHDRVVNVILPNSFAVPMLLNSYKNDTNFTFLKHHYDNKTDFSKVSSVGNNHTVMCGMISTRIHTFGQWVLVDCNEERQYMTICEKTLKTQEIKRSKLKRSSYECLHRNETYVGGSCFTFRTYQTWNQMSIVFREYISLLRLLYMYLSKWSRGRTNVVGLSRHNASHAWCTMRACAKCTDHDVHDWWPPHPRCLLNTTQFWMEDSRIHLVQAGCTGNGSQYRCHDGTCIRSQYVCDNISDCPDQSDELRCKNVCTAGYNCFTDCPKSICHCSQTYIQLFNKCVPLYVWYEQWTLNHYVNLTSPELSTKEHTMCSDGWSKCNPTKDSPCYPNTNICVFERTIYGDPKYCQNTNHLKNCMRHQCPSMFTCNNTYCIPFHMVCDGVTDCPDGRDEEHYHCETLSCPGMLKCRHDGRCIHPNSYCDGVVQCLISQDDEQFCEQCPSGCHCIGQSMFCYKLRTPLPDRIYTVAGLFIEIMFGEFTLKASNPNLNILNISSVSITNSLIRTSINNQTELKSLTMINNSLSRLESFVFSNLSRLMYFVLEINRIHHIDSYAFSGLHSIRHLNLSNLDIHVLEGCAFCQMATLTTLDISNNYITKIDPETVKFSYLIYSLNISNNDIKYFENSGILNNVYSLISRQIAICCYASVIVISCKSVNVDIFCKLILVNDPTSYSCALFVTFLLMINTYVIICQMSSNVNHFTLIQNLSFANLCYILYLITLTTTHFWYESQFPLKHQTWVQSTPCNFATFAFVLFLLQSKCSLLLVEINYLLVTKYSLTRRPLGRKAIRYLLSSMWSINITMAALFSKYTKTGDIYCTPYSRSSPYKTEIYILYSLFLIVRGIFLVTCYALILTTVYKSTKNVQQAASLSKKRRFRLLMVKSVVTISVFILSSCSIAVTMFWVSLSRYQWVELMILMLGVPFDVLTNPFLYTINMQSCKQPKCKH